MRVGRRAWSCSCNRRRPPRERGAVQVAPVGSTAMSNWALATSIPTPTSPAVAIGYPPATLATRPALQTRARSHGPGTCSGSAPASGPGRPCSLTVSHDPGEIGLSRPVHGHPGKSKARGTYKGATVLVSPMGCAATSSPVFATFAELPAWQGGESSEDADLMPRLSDFGSCSRSRQ